ncbi:MAG: hypothetical protein A3J09_01800 [Candidatus Zambryskibacteria bacterium RIFCSPLOWO2_02_FULL_51_21]|uniref:PilN domain-containing protein n=1 Tax=Candidatus Zambryskibacteria bacterium RIFCSPHIGHO2_02_FULL_43_37 TaxID=1802749 RepID=A0A1G2TGQ1_9BACT|nr:MAG: hypothetical protein A2723_01800 [Candidatus Zambryskibacteria bacterium RIFCSPHIGHO2_01_FULL_52_18]OHA96467.1 MAG: hypothetical protein A3D49_01100 [Candidatus Zambryskibacteria bacterium RIFCSPHIGHO2_02_FULL_43_37]OHB07230.1 MAG: hypothetical protein A2944_01540 [Candidatus Zambryskibacteria bacterium RIFCSPLOWO2_01_FULL_52_12]OHB11270.1 MAG: hypothetical protein A3J09_01800 [Candidatus Zambryskibacteria bacterium RIFCSPLOWO2_02_FULL_51_21]
MPPKFESSFIPKGPAAASAGATYGSAPLTAKRKGERTILGFIAGIVFTISIFAALAALGYKFYLNSSIENMKTELEAGRAALETETVSEIIRLNNRLLAAEALISRHRAVSPIFRFLDEATVKTVRFTDFYFSTDDIGPRVNIKGEAKSYAALALQAELMNKSPLFKNPVFSDLRLDDKGNVEFTFAASVDPTLVSYKKEIEKQQPTTNNLQPTATSTTTTTKSVATTTKATTTPR